MLRWQTCASMDWANDQLGRLVHAADRHLFTYGFSCPACGVRVKLRSGVQRRPHFAHYSHSPKPDCENYHPSTYPAPVFRPTPWKETHSSFERVSLGGGVFLDRQEGGRFTLYLRLPRLKQDIEVTGELRVQFGLGTRTFLPTQLLRPQFVRLSPQMPLVEVHGVGDMHEVAAAIEQDISLFRPTGNVFRAGPDSGRLLTPKEPLEWGETYRIFSQRPLPPPPFEVSCDLLAQASGWFLYEVMLPEAPEPDSATIGALSHFIGREIRKPAPRAYIIHPTPHHIEPDGTYVYPSPPVRLLLRRTSASMIEIQGSGWTEDGHTIDAGDWVEVCALGTGEAAISCDGKIQVSIRIEQCDLYQPQGIHVAVGADTLNLFDPKLRVALTEARLSRVVIQSPTSRIADHIRLNPKQWVQQGAQQTLREGITKPSIDAGNFGELTWPAQSPQIEVNQLFQPHEPAKRVWLEGLVSRVAGYEGLRQLREFWQHRDARRLDVFAGEAAWLKPYIQVALGKREHGK